MIQDLNVIVVYIHASIVKVVHIVYHAIILLVQNYVLKMRNVVAGVIEYTQKIVHAQMENLMILQMNYVKYVINNAVLVVYWLIIALSAIVMESQDKIIFLHAHVEEIE